MLKKLTLEDIIAKTGHKEFFYREPEKVKAIAFVSISSIINSFFTGDAANVETDVQNFLDNDITNDSFFSKYPLNETQQKLVLLSKENYQNPTIIAESFTRNLTQIELAALEYNAGYLKYVLEWCYQKPENGKRNFYTTADKNNFDISKYKVFKVFTKKRFLIAKNKKRKLTKQELFKAAKYCLYRWVLNRLKEATSNSEDEKYLLMLKQLADDLQTLTFEEINDRHKATTKPVKKEFVYRDFDNIAPLVHSQTLDFISVLAKVQTQKNEYSGEKILLWENKYLKAVTRLPLEAKNKPTFGVFVDKLITECRLRAYQTYNANITNQELTISYPIHEAMLQFGYAETKEQAQDSELQRSFMKEFRTTCKLLRDTEIEERQGKRTKFYLISSYTQAGEMKITFTSNFQKIVVLNNGGYFAEEYVLRSLASRIPNKKTTEYYLAKYLVSITTNKNNIAKGREDRLSLKSIIEHLEACNVLYSGDTTRNAQRRKIERVLKAFRWLSDNRIIQCYFYDMHDGEKMPIELSQDSYYLNNLATLEELAAWYVVPELEEFIEENREKFTTHLEAGKEKAKRARKRKAKTSKEELTTQAVESGDLSAWEQ